MNGFHLNGGKRTPKLICAHLVREYNFNFVTFIPKHLNFITPSLLYSVVTVDKVHWIFQVRADEIKCLFTPKV
jgi:hypothetical protein